MLKTEVFYPYLSLASLTNALDNSFSKVNPSTKTAV
jgi:hypothetical protein